MHDGREIQRLPAHSRSQQGIAVVLENRHLFGELSVRNNLTLAAVHSGRRRENARRFTLDQVLDLFPFMRARLDASVALLSGGEQQMVAIGRALMSAPAVLLLDEPSLGLSPLLCGELFRTLAEIRGMGIGILLVEQNARQSLRIADRGLLLETGRIVGRGSAAALQRDPAVQRAYLGGGT